MIPTDDQLKEWRERATAWLTDRAGRVVTRETALSEEHLALDVLELIAEVARLRPVESEIMRVVAAENLRCDSIASAPRLVEELAVIASTAAEEHAHNEQLRAELARLRPVYEAATEWMHVGHCNDCPVLHVDCVSACESPRVDRNLLYAVETAEAKEQP